MAENPILDELHSVREQRLEDAGGTLDALVDRLQTAEQESARPRYNTRQSIRSSRVVNTGELPTDNLSSPLGEP